jgi:serine/threonine protein kinase/tetratricopeptide (TPR) repeat protein
VGDSTSIPLGAFELTAPLGRGGMGVVWRGRHRQHGTPVAVKVITDASAREDRYQAAFRNEVRAVAGLSHPGVVQVFDFGLVDAAADAASGGRLQAGSPYLIMEYLRPDPLNEPVESFAQLRGILDQLLEALAHAHARGVIHRDLKPDNVLADPVTGRLKITDFGLAHTVNREATADDTLAGLAHTTAGTPDYMAPEQARARPREQGAWSDLYSLGCMAYALASGGPPFVRGTPIATLMAHLTEPVPALAARIPVPAGLDAWVRRMMAKTPQTRYRRAADAAYALDTLATDFEPPPPLSSAHLAVPTDISGDRTLEVDEAAIAEAESLIPVTVRLSEAELRALEEAVPHGRPPVPAQWRTPEDAQAHILPGTGLGLYGLRAVPFVGRLEERDRLWRTLRAVDQLDRAQVMVVTGPSGCGKSRLCEWLAERAHEVGAAFSLHVRSAVVEDQGSGFGPVWRRVFRAFDLFGDDLRTHLHWELSRLGFSPVEARALGDALAEVIAPDPTHSAVHFAGPREIFFTMARVIERLAQERCVLLWLDDAQWTRSGLDFVDFLLQRQSEVASRLLVVMTVRTEALADRPDESRRLADIVHRADVTQVEIGPLPPEDRPRLVRALLGLNSSLAHRVEARTAGNPLFAVQLVGDWVQRGVLESTPEGIRLRPGLVADALPLPRDLQEVWGERVRLFLAGRSSDEATALELAAVLGLHVDRDEWRQVCMLRRLAPLPDLRRLADALIDSGLAERDPDQPDRAFTFVHGMFREALETMAAEAGARWMADHQRVCAGMLRPCPGTHAAERRGRHALAAGDPADLEEAISALATAVAGRIETGEYDAADELLRLADTARDALSLAESDLHQGQLRLCRAQIAHLRGDRDRALELSVANEMDARRFGWTEVLAEAYRMLGAIALDRSQFAQAQARLEEASQLALEAGNLRLAGQAHEKLGSVFVAMGHFEPAERILTAARRELLDAGDEAGAGRAAVALARLMKKLGRLEDALSFNALAHAPFERAGDRNGLAACANQRGELLRLRGALSEAEIRYRQALEMWEAIGAGNAIFAQANLGLLLAEEERYAEARPLLLDVQARFRALRLQAPLAIAAACLAPTAAAAGDFEAVDAHLTEAEAIIGKTRLADLDAARMLEHAGNLCADAGEAARGRRAWLLAASQWRLLRHDDRAAEVEGRAGGR